MSEIKSFIYRFSLMVQYSRVNLKFTAITLIGLTIGLSMLSAPLFLLDTTRIDYVLSSLEEVKDKPNIDVQANTRIANEINSSTILNMEDQINLKIDEHGLTNIIQKDECPLLYSEVDQFRVIRKDVGQECHLAVDQIGIPDLNESVLAQCVEGSRFPSNHTEVLFFDSSLHGPLVSPNDQLNITCHFRKDTDSYSYTRTVTVVGVLTPSTLTNGSIFDTFIDLDYGDADYIITRLDFACDLTQSIQTEIQTQYDYNYRVRTRSYFQYFLNFTAITRENVLEVVTSLFKFEESWESVDSVPGYEMFEVYVNWSLFRLRINLMRFDFLYFSFVIADIPVLIIVALLVSFSLGVINVKRKKALVLLKSWGVSNRFVFLMMLLETLIIALCSGLLSLVGGIPLSLALGSSTGLLDFSRPINPLKLVISLETIHAVALLSFALTFLLYLPSLASLPKTKIIALSDENVKVKPGKIKSFFGKLDVMFLTLGSVGVLVAAALLNLLKMNVAGQMVFEALFPFFSFLLLFSPLLLLLGFISIFNRIILKFLYKLGSVFWKRDWRLLAIVTRNLVTTPYLTARTTLLMAITLALLVAFSILPVTLHFNSVDQAYYEVGSEISYSTNISDNFTSLVSNLGNVSGFSFITIKEASLSTSVPDPINPYHSYGFSLDFMGIEPNFAELAHWQPHYDNDPLETLVTTLFDSSLNNSVIVDSGTADREELTINSTYIIDHDLSAKRITVSISAIADYWPRLSRGSDTGGGFFVTQASFFDELANITDDPYSNRHLISHTVLGKVLPGYDQDQVISSIKEVLIKQDYSVDALRTVYDYEILQEDNILNTFLWFAVNTNLVAELAIILSAIILFTITKSLGRVQEIALSRSLGMKFPQLFLLVFTEPLVLFILSGIPGTLVGGTLTLVIILQFGRIAPLPYTLHIELFSIIGCYLLLFMVIVVVGFVTSLIVARTNISKMLKVE
ncbi:MAG: FtsX-like permease family protein [Promethearchaeota archaeon]